MHGRASGYHRPPNVCLFNSVEVTVEPDQAHFDDRSEIRHATTVMRSMQAMVKLLKFNRTCPQANLPSEVDEVSHRFHVQVQFG